MTPLCDISDRTGFVSLPRVLWMQLRQQFVTVDGLVDDVVATYHNGFNKAIHNYSHILQLFADTKAQVREASAGDALRALLSRRQLLGHGTHALNSVAPSPGGDGEAEPG